MEKVRLGIIGIGGMGSAHANNVVEGKVPNLVSDRLELIGQRKICQVK